MITTPMQQLADDIERNRHQQPTTNETILLVDELNRIRDALNEHTLKIQTRNINTHNSAEILSSLAERLYDIANVMDAYTLETLMATENE
jgi:hypothetical protein